MKLKKKEISIVTILGFFLLTAGSSSAACSDYVGVSADDSFNFIATYSFNGSTGRVMGSQIQVEFSGGTELYTVTLSYKLTILSVTEGTNECNVTYFGEAGGTVESGDQSDTLGNYTGTLFEIIGQDDSEASTQFFINKNIVNKTLTQDMSMIGVLTYEWDENGILETYRITSGEGAAATTFEMKRDTGLGMLFAGGLIVTIVAAVSG
ncbi:MAG: hypothetical protein GY870_05040, partial [archaeon]|nr:hypothetical protein [archaeon]